MRKCPFVELILLCIAGFQEGEQATSAKPVVGSTKRNQDSQ